MIRLVPRQESFFELLEKQAGLVNNGAKILVDLMANFTSDKLEEASFRIKSTEHDADEVAHEIIRKLNTTFVTPLDREDILAMTSALDDVLDYSEAAVDRMSMYEIREPTEASVKLADILMQSVEVTVQAVNHLRDLKHPELIREACVTINRLENQGDQMNRKALSELFKMDDRPIEALKWREIYGDIETAIDKCEDVADILESTILKNG